MKVTEAIAGLQTWQEKYGNELDVIFDCPSCRKSFPPNRIKWRRAMTDDPLKIAIAEELRAAYRGMARIGVFASDDELTKWIVSAIWPLVAARLAQEAQDLQEANDAIGALTKLAHGRCDDLLRRIETLEASAAASTRARRNGSRSHAS